MSETTVTSKKPFWTVIAFYLLIGFEFFYMASPFAIYFYSVYSPVLNFVADVPVLAWLSKVFLPHIVVETSSTLINSHNIVGGIIATVGFLAFCIGAGQVYYHKLARKGAVTGGVYNYIRHPQYVSFVTCSFGLLLLWPRYIVLLAWLAMLFAYYFLAKIEEAECEEKFGQSYIDYKRKTGMFLPFPVPFVENLPSLPSGALKYVAILALYMVVSLVGLGVASFINTLAIDSLYALYTKDAASISVAQIDQSTLKRVMEIAQADPSVQAKLPADAKFINYIVPAEWNISEVPMHHRTDVDGHYSPANYDHNLYKIVFTKAELRTNATAEGKEILTSASRRFVVTEVWINLAENKVTEVKGIPAEITYENIPVPVY